MFLIFLSVKHLNDFFQVAVNKLDTVKWSQDRFDEIVAKLKQFLKQVGFKDSDVRYVPCSGNPHSVEVVLLFGHATLYVLILMIWVPLLLPVPVIITCCRG